MAYFIWGAKTVFVSLLIIDVALLALVITITGRTKTPYQQVLPRKKEDPLRALHRIKPNRSAPLVNGWYESCRIRLGDTLMRTNESCLGGIFNDILLVIVYHYPLYDSIPTLTKFYDLAFKKVVICGPQKNDSYPVITVEVKAGHYAYECLGQAIRENPGYAGYMYINDDMIVNWWNLGRFNTNRIWIGSDIELGAEVGKPEPRGNWPWWSKKSPGLMTCGQTIKELENLAETGNMTSLYNIYMNNSRGKRLCRSGLSDFFYVPKRIANEFQIISNIFFRNKVFLEIAVPTILTFLDIELNFEHVYGFYLPKKYGYIDYSNGKLFWTEYNYLPLYFMHPFKLHTNRNRLSEFLFKTYVYYYGDKVSQCSNTVVN
ncbi:probable glycosyltransferase STELLO1 [Actinia tenebrosa]|uniref:Probable glycosyltransferase STELLO1 n=1 Tax=Actinia tenebrosa TaxID=6105 RepID=A0A6P8H2F4_ACTTE|nr:probable glycosyltransferase STELLO1 [Actinia tenebrosa]